MGEINIGCDIYIKLYPIPDLMINYIQLPRMQFDLEYVISKNYYLDSNQNL